MKVLRFFLKFILISSVCVLILFITGYLLTSGTYKVAATVVDNPFLPSSQINGVKLHLETFGKEDSPVVIMLHGGPGNDYRSILSLMPLSKEYRLVFYDQRGSGLSERVPAKEHTLETYIADLNEIVEKYGKGEKVRIIGHSWGAMLASAYVGRYPEKVEKVVLAEPGFLTPEMGMEFQKKFKIGFSFELLYYLIKSGFETLHVEGPDGDAKIDHFFGTFFSVDSDANPMSGYFCGGDKKNGKLDDWRFGAVSSISMQESGVDKDGNMIADFSRGVKNYTDKVLFIAGECNKIIGPEHQRMQTGLFPDSELKVIQDAGHTMFGEKPEKSMKIIREYFNEEI